MASIVPVTEAERVTREKVCSQCGGSFPLESYGKHPHTKDGRISVCHDCMVEAHKKPYRKLRERAKQGDWVPTGYGAPGFEKHLVEETKQQHGEIRLHLGHGVITQQHKRVAVVEPQPEQQREIEALNTVEAPEPQAAAPAVSAPALKETRPLTSLEAWLTEENTRGEYETFVLETLVVLRIGRNYILQTLDGSAPGKLIDPEWLLWTARQILHLPSDQDPQGLRFY